MVRLERTTTANADFVQLVLKLEQELRDRYGAIQDLYEPYNKVVDIDTVVVAYSDNVPVGCGCFKSHEDRTAEIKRMYVDVNYRQRGIAKQILHELENWAIALGYTNAVLETGEKQPESIALYEKAGYQFIANYEPYMDMVESVCMRKQFYTIRRFVTADVDAYKLIRLEALQTEAGMFGRSYIEEAAYTDEVWVNRVNNPDGACFGLYCDNELIGLTGIIKEDKDLNEAYMTQSYIRKQHRGRHLSRMLYEARLKWAKEHNIERLIIGHRASNLASKAANQHYGFKYTHNTERTWSDGSTEDMLYYELYL